MNIFGKTITLLFLAAMLASCNSGVATPPLSERIVYYYLVKPGENPIPEGSVRAAGLLAPTYADETFTSDTAADLRTALEIVLHDERNDWIGENLEAEIADITFRNGHADVTLQGEYFLAGAHPFAPLEDARMQILLTVFANPSVQTAAVSLNEDTIGNLGISDYREAKPNDYVFTHAEIETYLKEYAYAYVAPSPVPPTSTPLPTNTPLPTTTPISPTVTPTPTLVPGPTGTPIFPPIESFVGMWLNVDANTRNWAKIEINNNEDTLSARFVLLCTLTEEWMFSLYPDGLICDEDGASARYSGNPVLLFIDHGFATYNITLSLNGDTLHVTTFIHFTDNSGSADNTLEDDFRKLVLPDPSFPVSEQIVFYYFVDRAYHFVPEGSVRTPRLLFSAASDQPYTSDTAADLRTALELVLQDERNGWISRDLEIVDVTFRSGHADIVLQGEYSGESDEVLNAASMQILLTVFSNLSVQSAAVTLNGDTIGNLGVSSSTNTKPADYVYTRAEMETYLQEHAFREP